MGRHDVQNGRDKRRNLLTFSIELSIYKEESIE